MNELSKYSVDLQQQMIDRLRRDFPEILNINGEIDFEILRTLLNSRAVLQDDDMRFGFNWPQKMEAMKLAQSVTTATIRPNKAKSVNWDETGNIYVEGDNLETLKVLQRSYAGKIKLIYLDPPYNTGHDFVYQDDFEDSVDNYLKQTGQIDEEGRPYKTNTEEGGRFHTNWLNMMYPRLRLARNFLTDDGVLFISIGERELNNLTFMLNEIFGENNFVSQISLITGANQSGDGVNIQKNLEYILVYAKDANELHLNKIDPVDETLRNLNDAPTPLSTRLDMGYSIYYNPGTEEIIPVMDYDKSLVGTNDEELVYTDDSGLISRGFVPIRPGKRNGELHRWRWGFDTFKERLDEVVITNTKNGYKASFKQTGFSSPKNYWNYTVGTKQVKELFGGKQYFDYPKNTKLLEYIIKLATNQDSLVMDFFSGSGTTADALMRVNESDLGQRRFIMVQLPEKTPDGSKALEDGYATIPQIAQKRIRLAADQLSYGDRGFKVFELDSTNIQSWEAKEAGPEQGFLSFSANNIVEGRTDDDVLFEVMVKKGLDLALPVRKVDVDGGVIFDVAMGALFVISGNGVNRFVSETIVKKRDDYSARGLLVTSNVVFVDEAFISTEDKLNAIARLKDAGFDDDEIESI
ncbi:site-specific DNA-methyltransferase [Leuconostoc falkenbergense]